jgi:hypothetical protein
MKISSPVFLSAGEAVFQIAAKIHSRVIFAADGFGLLMKLNGRKPTTSSRFSVFPAYCLN